MKICRIVSQLDFGGVEKRLKLTSKFFKDHSENELIILVLGSGGKVCSEIMDFGFFVVVFNKKVRIPNPLLIFNTYKFLRFHKPDVIHTSGAEANFHGLIAGFLARVPVRIGEEIGFPNHGFIFRTLFKFVYFLSHHVIAISKAVEKCLIDLKEINKDKISVIYNPVAVLKSEEDCECGVSIQDLVFKSNKSKIFVTTCRLVPIKNLKFLIGVFHEYLQIRGNENSILWIIGEGPEKEKLILLTCEYQISEKVLFFGFVPNVIPLLKKSNFFILPSISEGFSISLVEAMLCGLPVLSTNVGGPSEIISHEDNGYLFDPQDRSQLLELMCKVNNLTESELGIIKLNAIEKGSEFSVENYGKNLLTLYYTNFGER
ncbi:N-acetyl-alpha-D-glucosaminyl L-malate synthase BshA [Cyclobacterium sediminis]